MQIFTTVVDYFLRLGSKESDNETILLKKRSLILLPLIIVPCAILWVSLYIWAEHYISASIPLTYIIVSVLSLWYFKKTHNINILHHSQMILVLILPFLLMWTIGGFASSSYVMIWAFYAPLAALIYDNSKNAFYWFYAFIGLVLFSAYIDHKIIEYCPNCCMAQSMIDAFYVLNIIGGLGGIYLLFKYFINQFTLSINRDFLTGLYNRRYFYEAGNALLEKNMRKNSDVTVATIDIDNFKLINDTYGHDIGDIALKEVVKILKQCFRNSDLMARFGGEEFCIMLDESSYQDMKALFERVRHMFELNEVKIKDQIIKYTVSIGIAYGKSTNLEHIIKISDQALYEAKNNGKNKIAIRLCS